MFEGFANVWTPVVLSRSLGAKKPLPVTLAGEKLVFFRDAEGKPRALFDQCPHRGVALSLGRVSRDGCLVCPFHEWEFDGKGRVQRVPLNPDAKRERLFARSVPVREVGGVVFAYTAAVDDAPCEPTVPDALTTPGLARTYLEVEWKAHWTRAMENMLDSPHVPFVHASTIGRFVRPHLKPDSRMNISWVDTPYGGRTESTVEHPPNVVAPRGSEDRAEEGATLDFYRPNMMVLNIPVPKQVFRMHAFCVPIDGERVRMLIVGARSFAKFPLLNFIFNHTNAKIAEQDRAVVESSRPVVVPPPAEEQSVRTDRATLQFRKYFYETLHAARAP